MTVQAPVIDRLSPVPLYFQLEHVLEHEIVASRWAPGAQLPSEPELCSHFGISRSVVRQALGRLEQQGLIIRRKGQGTYVAHSQPRTWLLQSVEGFFQDEVGRLGVHVTSSVLRCEIEPLPRWATDALELAENSLGVTLERLRSVDGLVAMHNVNHLPAAVAPAVRSLISEPNESLYRLLAEREDLRVAGGRRVLEAVNAGPRLAQLLRVDPGAALVFIESVSWGSDGRPFDCYRSWLRTDRMKIDIAVTSSLSPSGSRSRSRGA